MTCETFKAITAKSLLQATRAERVAAFKHFNECEECCKIADDLAELSEAEEAAIDRIVAEDVHSLDEEL